MAWTDILSSQTDKNSPLNQVLFDAIRGNLDYLYSAKFLKVSDVDYNAAAATAWKKYIIDDTYDYRDHLILVLGNIYFNIYIIVYNL